MWILKRIGKGIRRFLDGWGLVEACRALGLTALPSSVKSLGGWICSVTWLGSCTAIVGLGLGVVAATALGSLMHAIIS
jgi:hypothetical protein